MHSITSGFSGLALDRVTRKRERGEERRGETASARRYVVKEEHGGSFRIYSKYAEQRRAARANTDKRCANRGDKGRPSFRLVRGGGGERIEISSKKSGGDRRFCLPTKRP